mmetsp:Transcript_44961/g.137324  ORF Transcript_44961/g.137324 Transcript_44961/m.137324 type:complete len:116 (+) Transcript_44961:3249-3596(+)
MHPNPCVKVTMAKPKKMREVVSAASRKVRGLAICNSKFARGTNRADSKGQGQAAGISRKATSNDATVRTAKKEDMVDAIMTTRTLNVEAKYFPLDTPPDLRNAVKRFLTRDDQEK